MVERLDTLVDRWIDRLADGLADRWVNRLTDEIERPSEQRLDKRNVWLRVGADVLITMRYTLDLGSLSRRIFIGVGNGKGSIETEWFVKNHPTRNLKFERYKIETVNNEMSLEYDQMGMTEWLKENVKEEEYVVMKVESEVVEEMMRSKPIKMVQEMFLECKPKGLGFRAKKEDVEEEW